MSAYDEWLTAPPEPPPHDFSGKCEVCNTEHFNGPGEGFETNKCSCGTAECCESCDKCADCSDPVCPQCSVDISNRDERKLICAGCHQAYLDDLADPNEAGEELLEAALAKAPPPYSDLPHLHEPHPHAVAVHPICDQAEQMEIERRTECRGKAKHGESK